MFYRENEIIQSLIKGTNKGKIQWQNAYHSDFMKATKNINIFSEAEEAFAFEKEIYSVRYNFVVFYIEFVSKDSEEEELKPNLMLTIHRGSQSLVVYEFLNNKNLEELFSLAKYSTKGLSLMFIALINEYN